eukprot:3408408-Pleurochrysis_carterae.AAC.1
MLNTSFKQTDLHPSFDPSIRLRFKRKPFCDIFTAILTPPSNGAAMYKKTLPIVCAASHGTARKALHDFVQRYAPQFEAALPIIQDKHACPYGQLSGTHPGAGPTHPHPGAAPAGTRSQATTPAED